MVNPVLVRAKSALDWICAGYTPAPRGMAVLRVVFALYVLIWPRDLSWIGDMSPVVYFPPPGPFALLSGPASPGVITALTVIRAVVAIWVLIGWNTRIASIVLSIVLIVCSGIAYSFGKVNHGILFDLAPLMFGLAGWGAAFSLDARRGRAKDVDGYPLFVFGLFVAFAMFTAAGIKAATGWLDPSRQATRYFVAEDLTYSMATPGPLAKQILEIDSAVFWKFLDYATVSIEGLLVVAVFLPGLFRIGLILIGFFHLGVYLALGISFHNNVIVYAGFFMLPIVLWFPELSAARKRFKSKTTRSEAPTHSQPV